MSLVSWSGGCDSTLLLYGLAKAGGDVRALAINHPQVGAVEESKYARRSVLRRLDGLGLRVDYSEVEFGVRSRCVEVSDDGLSQPMIWALMVSQYLRKDEDAFFGYIKGDCVWHFRSEFVAAFDAMQRLQGKTGKVVFPLEWHSKETVVYELKMLGLFGDVWYCERPVGGKVCGKCPPCESVLCAEYLIGLRNRDNVDVVERKSV